MNLVTQSIDGNLLSWQDIEQEQVWGGILLGNGASLVLWDKFKYGSLFKTACVKNTIHRLGLKDLQIFRKLGTENFEAVLDALSTTDIIQGIIGDGSSNLQPYYYNIQHALFEAIYYVHPPDKLKDDNIRIFKVLHEVLQSYDFVFSTNYDLILYWTIMSQNRGAGFKDYFWNDGGFFDPNNTSIRGNPTRVLYLHGGIHLARLANGRTLKRCCTWEDGSLQESLWKPRDDEAIPLFITEGKSRDKEAAISRSEYLSFAMDEFKKYKKPLVVFGHSLGVSDDHLATTIQGWGETPIAFSLRPDNSRDVRQKKAYVRSRFPEAELYFFDSTTHPIGAFNLKLISREFTDFNPGSLFSASRRLVFPDSISATG
jgi:hypothetical protein